MATAAASALASRPVRTEFGGAGGHVRCQAKHADAPCLPKRIERTIERTHTRRWRALVSTSASSAHVSAFERPRSTAQKPDAIHGRYQARAGATPQPSHTHRHFFKPRVRRWRTTWDRLAYESQPFAKKVASALALFAPLGTKLGHSARVRTIKHRLERWRPLECPRRAAPMAAKECFGERTTSRDPKKTLCAGCARCAKSCTPPLCMRPSFRVS